MATITTKDGTTLYYKDWGTGKPVVLSHGWPLSSKVSRGMIDSFWLQGMKAGHKNTFDCIKAFSETDFTADRLNSDLLEFIA